MKTERRATKREFFAISLATVGGLLLSSDSSFAFERDQRQDDSSAFFEKYGGFWEKWKGLVTSLAAAVSIKELHLKAKRFYSTPESSKVFKPLLSIGHLAVEGRVEALGAQLAEVKVGEKLIRKQLRSLQRSYESRAVRVLNNLKIIPFGREGEWIFLIDSGLYCIHEAGLALKDGNLKRASLLLAIADEDRLILNKESFNWQFKESFKNLKEIDREQETYCYNQPPGTGVKVNEDIREEVGAAFIFHKELCRRLRDCLRSTVEKGRKLDRVFLSRIFFTEVQIVELLQKYLDYERIIAGRTGEMSQIEGQLEEFDKEFSSLLTTSINYDFMSNREVLLVLWHMQKTVEKFFSFNKEYNLLSESHEKDVANEERLELVI